MNLLNQFVSPSHLRFDTTESGSAMSPTDMAAEILRLTNALEESERVRKERTERTERSSAAVSAAAPDLSSIATALNTLALLATTTGEKDKSHIKDRKIEKDQQKLSGFTDIYLVLKFISSFDAYYNDGGQQNPLEFITSDAKETLAENILEMYEMPLKVRYHDDVCSPDSQVLQDILAYSVSLNPHEKPVHVFTKNPMAYTTKVDPDKIINYLNSLKRLARTLPMVTSQCTTATLLDFFLRGIQPADFREGFKSDYPDFSNMTIAEFTKAVGAEAQTQKFVYQRAVRNGIIKKATVPQSPPAVAAATAAGEAASVGGALPKRPHNPSIFENCSNCKSPDHRRRDCVEICKTCPRKGKVCGLPGNKCLQFQEKCRAWEQSKGLPLADNKDKEVREISISQICSIHDHNTTVPTVARDDCLFDTGTNRVILVKADAFDTEEELTSTAAQAVLPDNSLVPIESDGMFCGQKASLITRFDKNLIPADFFDKLHCAVVLIGGTAHVVSLTDSTCARLHAIINKDDIQNSTKLTMELQNGTYATSIEQLRASFPEFSSTPVANCSPLVALNSTYFTTSLSGLQELVKFWHLNLGHMSKRNMKTVVHNKLVDGLPTELTEAVIEDHFPLCDSCPNGNLSAKALPRVSSRVYEVGEACAIDVKVWGGPAGSPYLTHNGEGISIHAMDRGSGKSWVFLCKTVDGIEEYLERMHKIYALNKKSLREFQIDDQFVTKGVQQFLERVTIQNSNSDMIDIIDLHIAAPYTHGQNGAAESNIKTMQQLVVKQLTEHNLDPQWFGDCLLDSVDVLGFGPSKSDPKVSINERWNGERLNVRVTPILPFGSRVKAHIHIDDQKSLSGRTRSCIYIGRARGYKGSIKLRTLDTMAVIIRYSFKVMGIIDEWKPSHSQIIELELPAASIDIRVDERTGESMPGVQVPLPRTDGTKYKPALASALHTNQKAYLTKIDMRFTDKSDQRSYKIVSVEFQTHLCGKLSPTPKTPFFKHYDVGLYEFPPRSDAEYEWIPCSELFKDADTEWDVAINRLEISNMVSSCLYLDQALAYDWTGDVGDFCGKVHSQLRVNCVRLNPSFSSSVSVNRIDLKDIPAPRNYSGVLKHPEKEGYLASFLKEVAEIHKNGGDNLPEIDIKDIPPHLILQLMPIFQKKYEGLDFKKFKSRLVVLGNKWRNVFNEETYAGMAKMETLKMFLAIAAVEDMELSSSDVITAFLTTQVGNDTPYYVRRPPGVPDSIMPYIMQPACYFYGHPKAGRKFQEDYTRLLVDNGFVPTNYDPCCFVLHEVFGTAIVCTIVDDAPIAATTKEMEAHVHAIIKSKYNSTSTEKLTHIAGIEISRIREQRSITLKQNGKCEDLFDSSFPSWREMKIEDLPLTPMKEGNRSLPLTPSELLRFAQKCDAAETTRYRSKIGQLNWLTFTWPDVLFSQRDKAGEQVAPTNYDSDEADRIILYMIRMYKSDNPGLTIGGTLGVQIVATIDSSYNTSRSDRHGVTGGTMHMGSQLGAFQANKVNQPIVTDSSTSSEGVGAHVGVRIRLPKRYFLNELGFVQSTGSRIFMDNIPYMKTIIESKGPSDRSKHILIRFQVVKEAYMDGEITLEHLRTNDMVADILTKSLGATQFHRLRSVLLGVTPLAVPLEYTPNIKPNISPNN